MSAQSTGRKLLRAAATGALAAAALAAAALAAAATAASAFAATAAGAAAATAARLLALLALRVALARVVGAVVAFAAADATHVAFVAGLDVVLHPTRGLGDARIDLFLEIVGLLLGRDR